MRKVLVVVAALAIWATGAYPPWKMSVAHSESAIQVSTATSNDWLINEKHFRDLTPFASVRAGVGYSVDYGRLAIEWAIIAVLYWAAVQLLSTGVTK